MQFLVDTLNATEALYDWDANTIRMVLMVLVPVVIVQLVLLLAGLLSILKKQTEAMDKLPWLILLFVNIIGPILYFAIGSNMLDQKALDKEEGENLNG